MNPSAENPFASRYVRPGVLPFLSRESLERVDLNALIDRLRLRGWRGAIVGPHGSGKSTLLVRLAAELDRRQIGVQCLSGASSAATWSSTKHGGEAPHRVLLVDGFDQLPTWRRYLIRWQRCRKKWGIVVTTHVPVGLPVLWTTSTSWRLAAHLARVLAGETFAIAAAPQIRKSFARHAGNLREVLFDLYDLYERNQRNQAVTRSTGRHQPIT